MSTHGNQTPRAQVKEQLGISGGEDTLSDLDPKPGREGCQCWLLVAKPPEGLSAPASPSPNHTASKTFIEKPQSGPGAAGLTMDLGLSQTVTF